MYQKLLSLHKKIYGIDDQYLVERVFQCLRSSIPYLSSQRNITVADLGCGDLRASNLVHLCLSENNNISSFYAVDLNPHPFSMEDRDKFKILSCDLTNGELIIADKSVDFVYALEVIEHLWNVDVFVSEINRVLTDQGILVLTTPNLAALYNRLLLLLGIVPIHYELSLKKKYGRVFSQLGEGSEAVGHVRVFTPFALSKLLVDNVFEILELKGLPFLFDGFSSVFDKFFSHIPSFSSMFLLVARKTTRV